MQTPKAFWIYIVRRFSGELLILHPFRRESPIFRDPEGTILEGRYASEPGPGEAELIRTVLHEELEKGLRKDTLDRGFYLRLVISAGVFLVLYLFLSIVIRDPVPLVDELLVGGLGAFAAWFALERRALSSEDLALRSAYLRRTLDAAIFRPSLAAKYLEEFLQDVETLDPERLAEYPASPGGEGFSDEESRDLAELANALEARLLPEDVEEAKKSASDPGDIPRLIRRLAGRRKRDLPLLLSYIRIKVLSGVDG